MTNPDMEFLNFIRTRPLITAITADRIYGGPAIPPEQRTSQDQFCLVYPRPPGSQDEESAIGVRTYAVESYGLRPALCQRLDDAVYQSLENQATHLLRNIHLDVSRQVVQHPANQWWFAISAYRVIYAIKL